MRYWDDDNPDWDAQESDYATAWLSRPKWVVSRSLKSVGPKAILVADDIEAVIRGLEAEPAGENKEQRVAVIGLSSAGRLLTVVHIEFEGEFIRIIPAWRASPAEEAFYDQ
jgi:uncharacterized DUF497 family protein